MIAIRVLTAGDLPAAKDLLMRTSLTGGALNIGRYARWQPDGVWGGFDAGALLGTVSLLRFGEVGFVGCMAVEPALQGRGLGRQLLEHAHREGERAGVTTFLLEATPAGEPLYRKLGYVGEHETAIVARAAPAGAPSGEPIRIAPAELIALDREATGMPRDTMLASLVREHAGGVVRGVRGELAAYALAVDDRLGPVIACDAGAGRALIDRLAPGCTVANVPIANEAAFAAVLGHGFTEQRRLRRMRRGPAVAARPPWIWTLMSPGSG